jgi:hypothetical protein
MTMPVKLKSAKMMTTDDIGEVLPGWNRRRFDLYKGADCDRRAKNRKLRFDEEEDEDLEEDEEEFDGEDFM